MRKTQRVSQAVELTVIATVLTFLTVFISIQLYGVHYFDQSIKSINQLSKAFTHWYYPEDTDQHTFYGGPFNVKGEKPPAGNNGD
ncbi:hypothetical protein [Paenibacillus sp. OV219]|uniref:hypothetical protein n=1 Tax=Paenibacillus sp. OV219 TaxID=1884377 RepID=UPI000B86D81E|nr:hypothetical protein [Paenibacillus sp. OV219]